MKKIAFFDLDGTLTSEKDKSIPQSTIDSIRKARANGNLMFINSGRVFIDIGPKFRDIGFDGYICGCGTNIICGDKEIFHQTISHTVIQEILEAARRANVDLLFESKTALSFDITRPFINDHARRHYQRFVDEGYKMPTNYDSPDFTADKFVIWFDTKESLLDFRKTSDKYFECIERYEHFHEFVPYGITKATGIQKVLDYYNLSNENTFAFGDSNNDLPMLNFVSTSIAMGNSNPETLFDKVTYRTAKASEDGIKLALEHYGFI